MNQEGRVFWARRSANDGWQFPQGGMRTDETPVEAMYRELEEETGLTPNLVEVLGATPGWLRYRLPRRYQRHYSKPLCIGQKQVWFLLQFLGDDSAFALDNCAQPEFSTFRWVDFWYPVDNVITFKRQVYQKALSLLEPMAGDRL
jgi:putative (di)nucleoside polyphosphate hydrolase